MLTTGGKSKSHGGSRKASRGGKSKSHGGSRKVGGAKSKSRKMSMKPKGSKKSKKSKKSKRASRK